MTIKQEILRILITVVFFLTIAAAFLIGLHCGATYKQGFQAGFSSCQEQF